MIKIFYIMFLLLLVSVCEAQNLQGSYQEKRFAGEGTRILIFNKGHFKELYTYDLQTKLGYGSFNFKNNDLILNYEQFPNQEASSYELVVLRPSSNSNIELEIFDADSIPMYGVFGCRDLKNNALNIISTDKNGIGNMTILDNQNIGYFTIDYIGYHRISIPIKRLKHKQVKIKAYLKSQKNYYIEPSIETYKVVKKFNKQLILNKKGINYDFEKID